MSNYIELSFKQVLPLMLADIKTGRTPALLGEPGIGKSSLIEDLARTLKTKVFTLPVNQLADRADLTGVRMVPAENGRYKQEAFPHAIIMEAIEYAETHPDETPILFLDEFNRASSDITSSILSFETLRRVGTINFPPNLRLVVAGNDKGNIVGLDQASVSRFALYKVKPDLETFFANVPDLNPFVRDTLTKFPDLLVCDEEPESIVTTQQQDDDDDDKHDEINFAELEFDGDNGFTQITRPRTIDYLSQWLNEMGLKKTGSDEEKKLLADMIAHGENVLLAGIIAHVGYTPFAVQLNNEIQSYFNSMLSSAHVASAPLLSHIRPKQDYINILSRANNVQDVESLIASMTEQDLINMVIWLTEQASVKEINNNSAIQHFMNLAPHQISQFDSVAIQNFMKVLPNSSRLAKESLNSLINSNAPVMTQWKPMFESVINA